MRSHEQNLQLFRNYSWRKTQYTWTKKVSYTIQHTTDLPDPGNQASRSSFLAAAWLRAPDTMLTMRYGIRSA